MPMNSNARPQDVRARYIPGPTLGRGGYGLVLGAVDRISQVRFACKSINVAELLETRDGPNTLGRLRNEIAIMSYLAGHPHVRLIRAPSLCHKRVMVERARARVRRGPVMPHAGSQKALDRSY